MTPHPRSIDVAATIDHGEKRPDMTATRAQVLAMAVAPVGAGNASGPANAGASGPANAGASGPDRDRA
jgi:hypothetical protein